MAKLFCFGLGFSARTLAARVKAKGWSVMGTVRSEEKAAKVQAEGITPVIWPGSDPIPDLAEQLDTVTHMVISIPPGSNGDPVLHHHYDDMMRLRRIEWIGYLSTTGVYGNTGGAEVDETAPTNPTSDRSQRRVDAEDRWLDLFRERGLPVHVFRLAGIYGPGRSVLDNVRDGTARRIDKPDQRFSRIHVDDIAGVLEASIAKPNKGAIYNVCDDLPAPSAAVITYACELLGKTPPPYIPFEEAAKSMSPMGLSFWQDNRRVSNRKLHDELGVQLKYPTFRDGLKGILHAQGGGGGVSG